MLAGLRHRAFIGGNNQQRRINAPHPRQHIFDKVDMARHIDNANHVFGLCRQRQVSETEVNCHFTFLLLDQPIGVDAGEGLDQGAFAMIDVSGGGDSVMTHVYFRF